jgi:hypothetical protein
MRVLFKEKRKFNKIVLSLLAVVAILWVTRIYQQGFAIPF